VAGLDGEDPRLVMSIPRGRCLPTTINSRYVLTAFRLDDERLDRAVVELILPASMMDRIHTLPGVVGDVPFRPSAAGETADDVPILVAFSTASPFDLGPEVLEGWRQAVLAERGHGRRSQFRRSHEPVVYRAATDLDFRRDLLDRAFPR
jgi:5-methylcytosine-specific restriction protein A